MRLLRLALENKKWDLAACTLILTAAHSLQGHTLQAMGDTLNDRKKDGKQPKKES